jgi:hypothetical protein
MMTNPETERVRLWQWVKKNPAPALTITGAFFYAVLLVPATFFYTRLGTAPAEVGFTYIGVLSGSVLEAGIAILVLAFALYLVSIIVFCIVAVVVVPFILAPVIRGLLESGS